MGAFDDAIAVKKVADNRWLGDIPPGWRIGEVPNGGLVLALAGAVLTYVWGGSQQPGDMIANPYFDDRGRIIVLRSSAEATGRWFEEEIDFIADFQRAFGYTPAQPLYVAISADSDDTGGRSHGVVAELTFGS